MVYPVGSIYIGLTDNCPLEDIGVGTWEKIAEDRVLQGSSEAHPVGEEIAAGLPNITGQASGVNHKTDIYNLLGSVSGAFINVTLWRDYITVINTMAAGNGCAGIGINASHSSSVYGKSDTVQPPALSVNIWQRIA